MRRLLLALLISSTAAIAVAVPVIAADPATGTVSGAATKAEWTGAPVPDLTEATLIGFAEAGGTNGFCDPEPPTCDTYTLKVADAGTKLTVVIKPDFEEDWAAVEVIDPDGNATYQYNQENTETVTLTNPKTGDYLVHVLGATLAPDMPYKGTATLEGATPPVTETATPTPTPAPTPSPTPQPAPAGPPASSPAPPAQAGPRRLALEPDRRRVGLAARFGFRVRVLCRGGCAKVKLRAYVSNLTARNLKLGRFTGDAEVAAARILRDAEGRRQVVVTFKPSLRRKLAGARTLPIAIEAVATDPDGEVRTFTKRITLRR
jgi:hypothetical protein